MTQLELLQSFTAMEWGLIGLVAIAVFALIIWVSNKVEDALIPQDQDLYAIDTKPPEEPVRPHVRAGAPKDWKRDY